MTVGGILGRLAISAVFVVVTFVIEHTLSRVRTRRVQSFRAEKTAYQIKLDEVLRDVAKERVIARERNPGSVISSRRDFRSLSPQEQQAKKDWARAGLMKHPKIPSWKDDSEYLSLILSSARGGCAEAMNKLSEYAYRKKAYVEAYYWTLKLELAGDRVTGPQPSVILREWLNHDTSGKHRRFHEGFYEDQYRFARSVMRIRSGRDKERGLQRLRWLVRNGNPDAVLYAEKNAPEASTGESFDGGEKLG